MTTDQFDRTLG